jgi:hypothetical protein
VSDPNVDVSCSDILYSRTEAVPPFDIFVRRSARLSGVDQQPSSPKPDPDEVYGTSLLVMFRKLTIH